jgi:hypothetical protein
MRKGVAAYAYGATAMVNIVSMDPATTDNMDGDPADATAPPMNKEDVAIAGFVGAAVVAFVFCIVTFVAVPTPVPVAETMKLYDQTPKPLLVTDRPARVILPVVPAGTLYQS